MLGTSSGNRCQSRPTSSTLRAAAKKFVVPGAAGRYRGEYLPTRLRRRPRAASGGEAGGIRTQQRRRADTQSAKSRSAGTKLSHSKRAPKVLPFLRQKRCLDAATKRQGRLPRPPSLALFLCLEFKRFSDASRTNVLACGEKGRYDRVSDAVPDSAFSVDTRRISLGSACRSRRQIPNLGLI